MRLDAFRRSQANENPVARAAAIDALQRDEAERLEPALFAVWLTDSSYEVRRAVESALHRRGEDARKERPIPDDTTKDALAVELAEEEGFIALLAGSERGRDVLQHLPLERVPLEDLLLEEALRSEAPVLAAILALPLDVSGRSASLLARTRELDRPRRDALVGALVNAALQSAGVTDGKERDRTRAAFVLWFEGLLEAPEAATFETFVAAGAKVQTGVVALAAETPAASSMTALADLARTVYLALAQKDPILDRGALEADLASTHAELRAVAWRLLARDGLVTPGELLAAAAREEPGVAVELLGSLPAAGGAGGRDAPHAALPPAFAPELMGFLGSKRATVRRAAAKVLRENPVIAALASATLDPRAESAPLEVLAAQPALLGVPALVAYLEVDRPPAKLAAALARLARAPSLTWPRWPALLEHRSRRVRRAAQAALERLPLADGPAVASRIIQILGDDPYAGLRLIEKFSLQGQEDAVTRVLLDEAVSDETAETAVRILGRAGAWTALWRFVVGEKKKRYGSRGARRRALEALLALRPQPLEAKLFGQEEPRVPYSRAEVPALRALLEDQDPNQGALALLYVSEHGVPRELELELGRFAARAFDMGVRSKSDRRRRACWTRLLRKLFRIRPQGRTGAAVKLLPSILEAARRFRDISIAWTELLHHPSLEVRRSAVRLLMIKRSASLAELLPKLEAETALEAVRVAHPDEVEALVLDQLALALRGGRAELAPVVAWIEARPNARYVPLLVQLLRDPIRKGAASEALFALMGAGHRALVLAAIRTTPRTEEELAAALALIERLDAPELVPDLLPSLSWASEAARQKLVELARRAREKKIDLKTHALAPLLEHQVLDVRLLALSFLRATGAPGLWETVRVHAPRTASTDFAKAFLGVLEDQYEDEMGLAIEGLLGHGNGEVARRALKLLSRREREIATLALLEHLEDEELRQPVLTAFATWATRFLGKGLSPELLEDARREVRAKIMALATGTRATVLETLARPSTVSFVRAAALFAIGRQGLDERRGDVRAALAQNDPVIQRCAAFAAASLGGDDEMDGLLRRLAAAREPEVRATARQALVKRLDPAKSRPELESILSDPAPEVRLAVVQACVERPAVLGAISLEAWIGDESPAVRLLVLKGLAKGPKKPASVLRPALGDTHPEMRQAALEVVLAWGALDEVKREVGDLLADPSIHVSGAALDVLEKEARK
jgi:hypothetical protein